MLCSNIHSQCINIISKAWRWIILFTCLALISSCGFKPLYDTKSFDKIRGKIDVVVRGDNKDNVHELTSELNRAFSYRLSDNKHPKPYRLEVEMHKAMSDFAISRYSYSTRRKISSTISFKLIDNIKSTVLDHGTLNNFSSFDLSQTSDYSNNMGADFSTKNNIKILADQLVVRCTAVIVGS